MPQFDEAARLKHYRAMRLQIWEDLRRQRDEYNVYWQEGEGLSRDGARFDESRFRGPVNLFVDELLTHANIVDARAIARSFPASWGAASEEVLYQPLEVMRVFIERSLPEPQWGGRVVDLAVAADASKWKPWLSARLRTLGVGTDHAFPRPQAPGVGTGATPPVPTSTSSWVVAGTVAAVTAAAVGLYAVVRGRQANQTRAPHEDGEVR